MKPFLKWVGGKNQIVDNIIDKFPKNINTYFEIFIGGGSILFSLLQNTTIKCKKINAYDINIALIWTYKNIQNRPEEFSVCISDIINKYYTSNDKEKFYYEIRNSFNKLEDKTTCESSSYFVFLNKTCFRGLFREGPNGFNVPYGSYKNPTIFNISEINEISSLIKNVNFEVIDFKKSLLNIFNKDDFVYLDPPYYPENKKSFVKYNTLSFTENDHILLFKMCKELNCKFLLSNSYTEFVLEQFKNYKKDKILCKRRINSKNPESTTYELLIYN